MPTARRNRKYDVPTEEMWEIVANPHHLPRWWPKVLRVEGVSDDGFTEVMQTPKGAIVRADWRLTQAEPEDRRIVWEQEIEGTPFDRVLADARRTISVREAGTGCIVEIVVDVTMKGASKFGGTMVRGAQRKQLGEALDGLAQLHGD